MFSSTDKIHGTYNLLVLQLLENSRWCKLNPRNVYTLRTIKAVITVCFAAAVNNSSCHHASLKKRNAVDHLIKCPISLDLCLPSQQGKLPFSPMMSRFTINTIAFQLWFPVCQPAKETAAIFETINDDIKACWVQSAPVSAGWQVNTVL